MQKYQLEGTYVQIIASSFKINRREGPTPFLDVATVHFKEKNKHLYMTFTVDIDFVLKFKLSIWSNSLPFHIYSCHRKHMKKTKEQFHMSPSSNINQCDIQWSIIKTVFVDPQLDKICEQTGKQTNSFTKETGSTQGFFLQEYHRRKTRLNLLHKLTAASIYYKIHIAEQVIVKVFLKQQQCFCVMFNDQYINGSRGLNECVDLLFSLLL